MGSDLGSLGRPGVLAIRSSSVAGTVVHVFETHLACVCETMGLWLWKARENAGPGLGAHMQAYSIHPLEARLCTVTSWGGARCSGSSSGICEATVAAAAFAAAGSAAAAAAKHQRLHLPDSQALAHT